MQHACMHSTCMMSEEKRVRGPYRMGNKVPRQTLHNRKRKTQNDPVLSVEKVSRLHSAHESDIMDDSHSNVTASTGGDVDVPEECLALTQASESFMSDDDVDCDTSTSDECVLAEPVVKPQMLYSGSLLTPASSNLLIRSFSSRHNLTVRAKRDLLQLLHLHLPKDLDNLLPASLHHLNKSEALSETSAALSYKHHYYCSRCSTPFDASACNSDSMCTSCSAYITDSFVTISIEEQIKALVESKLLTI